MIPIIKVPWEGPPTPRNGALSMARIFLRLHENLGIILKDLVNAAGSKN